MGEEGAGVLVPTEPPKLCRVQSTEGSCSPPAPGLGSPWHSVSPLGQPHPAGSSRPHLLFQRSHSRAPVSPGFRPPPPCLSQLCKHQRASRAGNGALGNRNRKDHGLGASGFFQGPRLPHGRTATRRKERRQAAELGVQCGPFPEDRKGVFVALEDECQVGGEELWIRSCEWFGFRSFC